MKIIETFDSIQGEGIHAGIPMSFIRLAGCNMDPPCQWCDTAYAQVDDDTQDIPITDINPSKKWICITGGEPLVQQDELELLVRRLHKHHFIEIESNGSIYPPSWAFLKLPFGNELIPLVDSWVIDVKLPSSGNESFRSTIRAWTRPMKGRSCDQIKFVVADEEDLNEAVSWINFLSLYQNVIVSPVMPSPRIWLERVAGFCINRDIRLSIQLHKVIWGNKRGV